MSFPSATGAVSCHLNPGAGSEASQPHRRRPEPPPRSIPTPRFRIGCQRSQLEGWALKISSCFMVSRCRKFWFLGSVEAAVRKPGRTPPPPLSAGGLSSPHPPGLPSNPGSKQHPAHCGFPHPQRPAQSPNFSSHPASPPSPSLCDSTRFLAGDQSAACPPGPQPLLESSPRSLVCG